MALIFHMLQPPVLVLPKTTTLSTKVEDPLYFLCTLAMQTSFIVHTEFPGWPPLAALTQLCSAVLEHKLPSSMHRGLTVVKTLYQGSGGQVYQGNCLADLVSSPAPLPPPYAAASASPLCANPYGSHQHPRDEDDAGASPGPSKRRRLGPRSELDTKTDKESQAPVLNSNLLYLLDCILANLLQIRNVKDENQ